MEEILHLPDADARASAATDFATNLVVLAGAGTGKTSLLVERMLNAIGSGTVELDGVAAITFTEKAAGEMRERLATGLDRLRGLARGESVPGAGDEADRSFAFLTQAATNPLDTIAARALAAMEQLDRATVTTIHGFCAELLRRHPVQARVDPDFIVDTGEHEISLGLAAWDDFVVRELGPEAGRAELWTGLLDELPLSTLRGVALELASFGVPEAALRPPIAAPDAGALLTTELSEVITAVDDLLGRASGMTPMARNYFGGVQRVFAALRDGGLKSMREALAADPDLVGRIEGRRAPTPNKKLEGVSPEEMKRLSARTQRLAADLLRVDDELLVRVVEAVAPFALAFREDFLRRGFVSFDGLLSLARDLLRDAPDVRRSLKQRFRMILIDEFQDTDPVQHEIALFLGEDPAAHAEDPYATALGAGRLFVVGDAKQSIYRFRGADYAAYRRAVERIVDAGGESLDLVANFRSVPGVVEAVNRLFAATDGAWESSDYQPGYMPIRAVVSGSAESSNEPAVELWTVGVPPGARADERREAEGRLLAQSIRQLIDEHHISSYRDITILFRAFSNISYYLRPLRELGVPFVVDGGREFLERPEVGQLMAILRALAQPADTPALLAFLRSPAGGVSDAELADFKDAGGRFDWRATDPAVSGRVVDCFRLLRELSLETKYLPADATVRRVVERLLLLPLGAAAFEGPQRVANLSKLSAAAGELARDGRLCLEQVVEALREGRLQDIQSDRPLSDDAAKAVRITSIHRMKGLENDWIFLPDFARQDASGRGDAHTVRVARPPGATPTLAPTLALATGGAGGALSGARVWLDMEGRRHEKAEETRVLYVALTRARKRLVVLASRPSGAAPWIDAMQPWGYDVQAPPADGALLCDGAVLHRLPQIATATTVDAKESTAGASQAVQRYAEAVERLKAAAVPPLAAPSELKHGEPAPEVHRGAEVGREIGRCVGIVIHRLLELWPGDDRVKIDTLADALVASTARTEGVDPAALRAETGTLLAAFLVSPLASELTRIDAVGREVPLLLRADEGRAFRGTIDLLYRDRDGALVVADFKTDRDTDEASLRERYSPQLETYARAVTLALNLPSPPRTELWVLRNGSRLTLTPS